MHSFRKHNVLLLVMLGPLLAGCGAGSDLLSKDAEWFSRPSRMFNRTSLALETPPLTQLRAVTPDDLISAEGYCAGMTPPGEANAMSDGGSTTSAVPGAVTAGVTLGQTECEVARFAGAPTNVNLSSGDRGERVAVLTYLQGPRPGIYRFSEGRLAVIERAPDAGPARAPRASKPKKRAT